MLSVAPHPVAMPVSITTNHMIFTAVMIPELAPCLHVLSLALSWHSSTAHSALVLAPAEPKNTEIKSKNKLVVQIAAKERLCRGAAGQALQQVTKNVWSMGRPFLWNGIDVGGRAAVVRLSDGTLWVHSPLKLDEGLKQALAQLGEVRHIVSPNFEHTSFASEVRHHAFRQCFQSLNFQFAACMLECNWLCSLMQSSCMLSLFCNLAAVTSALWVGPLTDVREFQQSA